MMQILQEEWDRLSDEFKICNDGQPRQVYLGAITMGGGKKLITESIDFEIVAGSGSIGMTGFQREAYILMLLAGRSSEATEYRGKCLRESTGRMLP